MKKLSFRLACLSLLIFIGVNSSYAQYNSDTPKEAIPVTESAFDAAKIEVEKMRLKYTSQLELTDDQQVKLEDINQKYLYELQELDTQILTKSQLRKKKLYAHHKQLFAIKSILNRSQTLHFKNLIKNDMGGMQRSPK